jgi:hypothetical protein
MANLLTFILVHVCWKVFLGFSILFTSCCIIKSNLCLFHINRLSAYFWQRSRDQDYCFQPLQPHRLKDCSLNSVQLFNHFINSSQMPWQAQYNVKTMGGEKGDPPIPLRLQQVLVKPRRTEAVYWRQRGGGLLSLVNLPSHPDHLICKWNAPIPLTDKIGLVTIWVGLPLFTLWWSSYEDMMTHCQNYILPENMVCMVW